MQTCCEIQEKKTAVRYPKTYEAVNVNQHTQSCHFWLKFSLENHR